MGVRFMTVTGSSAHASVVPRFVADIAELVDGCIYALVPDICGCILVEVLHALRAVICAVSRGECWGRAAYHNFTHITIISTIIFIFGIIEGIVLGPPHVADDSLGI